MSKRIRERTYHESTTYHLHYDRTDLPGAGFAFPCNADGDVDFEAMNPCARKNYDLVTRDTTAAYHAPEIVESVARWVEEAIIECSCCQASVNLYDFTNTCAVCGTDYNMSGYELLPREEWVD